MRSREEIEREVNAAIDLANDRRDNAQSWQRGMSVLTELAVRQRKVTIELLLDVRELLCGLDMLLETRR